jgi:hypothetical protein
MVNPFLEFATRLRMQTKRYCDFGRGLAFSSHLSGTTALCAGGARDELTRSGSCGVRQLAAALLARDLSPATIRAACCGRKRPQAGVWRAEDIFHKKGLI